MQENRRRRLRKARLCGDKDDGPCILPTLLNVACPVMCGQASQRWFRVSTSFVLVGTDCLAS